MALSLPAAQQSSAPETEPSLSPPDLLSSLGDQPKVKMPDPGRGILSLDVVVTDESGKPVTGLSPESLTLLDNGRPQPVVTLDAFNASAKPDVPVEIIVVFDELDLDPTQASLAEEQVQHYLRKKVFLSQPFLFYRISEDGLSAPEFPWIDGNRLADEIVHRTEPRIWKEWRPGHFEATPELTALGRIAIQARRRPARKLVLWIANGWPTLIGDRERFFSSVTELSTRLREARITLYEVSVQQLTDTQQIREGIRNAPASSRDVARDDLSLEVLAAQSGGRVLTTYDVADLVDKQIAVANNFYTLTFDPPPTGVVDDYHTLKIQIAGRDFIGHTNTGYYDEPNFYDQEPPGIEHTTVAGLEAMLGGRESGSALAHRLSHTELTERLTGARLVSLQSAIRNKEVREALAALADRAAFLAPPINEMPTDRPPAASTQKVILARAIEYVQSVIPRLPNFFAKRTTRLYQQKPLAKGGMWKTISGDQALDPTQTSTVTVLFRDGKEAVQGARTVGRLRHGEQDLETVGTFGPILAMISKAIDASHNQVTWLRWEKGPTGPLAVFHYAADRAHPLFEVGFCCLANDSRDDSFQRRVPFEGEVAIDPTSGAILRLTVQADLEPRLPLKRSGIVVEYGPVTIGGKSYICPIHSVSVSRQRTIVVLHEWGEQFKVYAPFTTDLNDVVFSNHHRFRAESRILPGYTP